MAHEEQRTIPVCQRLFEPFQRLRIEVIGRFIADQQVGTFEQQAREQGAGLLPAAAMRQGHVPQIAVEAEAREHLLDAELVFVAARELEGFLQAAVALQLLIRDGAVCHRLLQAAELGSLRFEGREDSAHLLVHGVRRIGESRHGILLQVADAGLACHEDGAGAGLGGADQDAQQRGLADAVGTDEADFRAVRNAAAQPGKDIGAAKRLTQLIKG
ncbi:MAG: hypothetical protein BWY25_02829 [Chloroflexi bacterium ADurb.Bin222]|nr:MAG: hypothetical protein BWY25_02829 [Chloroflexi bacterium ADurb.Bin222]